MNAKRPHVYLDHNAGAPMRPAVKDRMIEVMSDVGNASSVHSDGRRARARIEAAREAVAQLCGARSRAVTFVSGGTEANMTVLTPQWQDQGAPFYLDRLLRSAVEHPSVTAGGRFAAMSQEVLPVTADGNVRLEDLEQRLAAGEPALVSVMAANNETGVIQPLEEIGRLVKAAGGFFHVDAVQAAGRMPIDLNAWQADAVTLSAHKFGGPQGMGAVVVRSTARVPAALLTGGGQENWHRAGTENTAGIAGFGVAAEEAAAEGADSARMKGLQDSLEAGLRTICPDVTIFGAAAPRLANTTCFAVEGVAAETALIAFDLERISLSSGSACSSGKVSVSHVLSAMGVDEAAARCALRVSLGWNSTEADVARFLEVWPSIVDRLNPKARSRAA
ncbi:cysteine desulfurase family protein [Roseibium litorale]|uniref:Cysteine desulfurase n=1 Tax=Roseibium litorale TaxID=2803841 RepID=A0ABR9CTI4_9HYPH|nr:cysteine desulfurase family protein [Roseibium litorale]MBD8894157.1 cysteine desulfurase [Roseibium litorale]